MTNKSVMTFISVNKISVWLSVITSVNKWVNSDYISGSLGQISKVTWSTLSYSLEEYDITLHREIYNVFLLYIGLHISQNSHMPSCHA